MASRQLSYRNQGSPTVQPTRTGIPERLIAAGTAAVAFLCYHATLLPGLDLGDSASFQTAVGYLTLTPRQAYPLYYALGNLFVWLHPGEPARVANLASAVYGAIAVGIATLVTAKVAQSRIGATAAGLFLAFSYTFWSQAVTAEVYTLHLLIVGAATLALMRWAERPTVARLAAFYAVYAVGFGNHLSMVLWLPAFSVFLLLHRRAGADDPLRPRMIALAIAIAVAGALQYSWNFRGLWAELEPPTSTAAALGKLWVDATKADWRDTLVMNVSDSGLQNRPAMHWFDLRQQFGLPGVALAGLGALYILIRWPKRGVFLILAYGANLIFAWTYNVGDVYIFFLPSHYVLALCAGGGVAAVADVVSRVSTRAIATTAGVLCLTYPVWRGYDTFPAVDRSGDNRAFELLDQFTSPSQRKPLTQTASAGAVFGVDTNWQVQNAFEYFMRRHKPATPWFHTEQLEWLENGDVAASVNTFVNANHEIGREVLVGPVALNKLRLLGYRGGATDVRLFETRREVADPFSTRLLSLRSGTPYALAILLPDREYPLDRQALATSWRWLTAGAAEPRELRAYTIVVGTVGAAPALVRSEDRPYRLRTTLGSLHVDVRMESWLPTDTIRRGGFGHVIVDHMHVLTLERGISFAPLRPGGTAAYSSGLFAPIPRYALDGR